MEASTLSHAGQPGLLIRSPALLRLYGDERLVAAIRGGNPRAFDVLFERYRAKLLAFCRGIVRSTEDGEDVLQDVFVSAHAAMLADTRAINVKPWLYRIARNRCLNHLRKPVADGKDTMDGLPHANGASTADAAAGREEMRAVFADVAELPETQRTALVLREIDDLSYEDIAVAMGTTLPAVKSLLVRARMALAEASESRVLTCDEVRLELAEAAEGIRKVGGGIRHHVRHCSGCERYRAQLRSSTRELRALVPFAPFAFLATIRHAIVAKLGGAGSAATGSSGAGAAGAGAGGTAGVAGGLGAGGAGIGAAGATGVAGGAGGLIGGGAIGAVGVKAAGVATAALLTAGAVGVSHYAASPMTLPSVPAKVAPAAKPRAVTRYVKAPRHTAATTAATAKTTSAAAPPPASSVPATDPVPAATTDPAPTDPVVADAPATPRPPDTAGTADTTGATGTESSGQASTPDPTASGSSDGDGSGATDPPPYVPPPDPTPPPPLPPDPPPPPPDPGPPSPPPPDLSPPPSVS